MLLPLHLNGLNLDSGTALASITAGPWTEAQIVSGGQTIIIGLTNETWIADITAQRQAIIDGLDSAQSELLGWNNEVRDKEVVTSVVRTSDTVVTITLTAAPAYDITADETITVTVPGAALTGAVPLTGTSTIGVETFVKRRKGGRSKRLYVVEVDGQFIQVRNISEAESVLRQVRELAEESAQRDVHDEITPKPPKVSVKTGSGKVTTSVTLQRAVRQTQRVVTRAYTVAAETLRKERAIDREIAVLIHDKIEVEEEQAVLALLL